MLSLASHHVLGDVPLPPSIPVQANFNRDIEEYGLRLVPEIFRELDPAVAFVGREIGSVNVAERAAGN